MKHALSVSLNKLGDLQHTCGDVADACRCYEEALSLRRQLAQHAEQDSSVGVRLDLVISLVKVANAQETLGEAELAQPLLEEASKLTTGLADNVNDGDKANSSKLRSVQAYFDSRA